MPPELIGQTLLNQYHIEEFIAQTPLGSLYRAIDTRSNKFLALTHLPKVISENSEALKEFDSQSSKLRLLSNPALAVYYGVLQTPTLAFTLEDWVDGPSLRDVLNRGTVSVNEALIFSKSLCAALDVLHKQNLLHLNLAPEFIRISKHGEIVLSGIALAHPIGTKNVKSPNRYPPYYYAPEQFQSEPLTTAADIYSLSVLLYQLTTSAWINGKSAPKTNDAIRRVHVEVTPPAPISINPAIPDNFSRMILWALRKKPDDRFKTTTELLSALTLAVRTSADEVPLLATPKTAPVTGALLSEWQYLPTPKPNIIAQDLPPLQDRLANISTSDTKKKKRRFNLVPVFVFILIAGFASLFFLVRPAPQDGIATPIQFTPFAANYTPPPTFTPLPKPTKEHGGQIAYVCTRGDYNQLCIVNRDGTGVTQMTDMDASNYYPVFTPDGGSLLFSSNRNGSFDLYLLLFSEKQLFQITNNVGNVVSPDYSPDGRQIVFANRAGDGPTSIWMVNADGLNPHLVYTGTGEIVATAWSPDGEKIAYAMSVGIPQEYEIFTMDINGKNHVRLTQGLQGIGGSIDWAPDGRNLLIYAGPFGNKDIFKLEVATGQTTQLTDGGNNAGGVYSPDGKYIVFNSLRNNDQADLYIMRSDGSNQQQLTNNPEPDWGPQWSP